MGHTDRIGITLGDPTGIGPEIVARALAEAGPELRRRLLLFGNRSVLVRGAEHAGATLPPDVPLVDPYPNLTTDLVLPGQPSASAGAAQVAYLGAAVRAAADGEIAGLVTAPMSKTTARAADFRFTGHTEYLRDQLGCPRVAMMFAGPRYKLVLATTHVPLMSLATELTRDQIVTVTLMAVESLRRDFGIPCPKIGVLGLNPHAGEGGLFGHEEATIILPAIETCRHHLCSSIDIVGPLVPDSAFRMKLDLWVALYHDQGLIPVKLIDFEQSVNVTLGLPIVRTSPDHGVAYDIAGKGIARAQSFIAALDLCVKLVAARAPAPAPPG
jgi:4-hydroxythreonine-4-phosphate dehydrogenase